MRDKERWIVTYWERDGEIERDREWETEEGSHESII